MKTMKCGLQLLLLEMGRILRIKLKQFNFQYFPNLNNFMLFRSKNYFGNTKSNFTGYAALFKRILGNISTVFEMGIHRRQTSDGKIQFTLRIIKPFLTKLMSE